MENENSKPMTEKEALSRISNLAKTWGQPSGDMQQADGSDHNGTQSMPPKPQQKNLD